jgi:hypothetical protein
MGARSAEAPSGVKQRYQLDTEVGRLTPAERAARGNEARAEVPRGDHAALACAVTSGRLTAERDL